ncbi:Asp-tRNA(Asn)/Glu-tRNA(Gln) amidotransferase subunit GatC [Spirosoma sp. KUDC1026]|jgi:aspartyl-tRNA(Asn)/glutamyl-tRNA(Gln) amidotransferase subunit C|uniref:Asp-tRNA(Asn)/Glu-tRNA(Gln) amidotransferase subunit GatC n=1 Tax=Spirosoma sp. KUDC1026 TaxID=2745947 RepID=UPI00159BE6E0|nr:Asp-tRNA(Asn)/Glu-tRNA(Gln) amidotransferase subunit GatC [Spirosoma sp. KUDC1026]QKZ11789.1 Asp-tRNA(Asn)/Glu-tRNA(Gln) amidotransferase subunit GatC [Spirosoma sp. KUDC1026]
MKVDQETLHKIAHLARLNVRPEEEAELLNSLNGVLDWMEQLNEVDTTGVEPLTHISAETNVLRDDRVAQHLPREQALANAPQHDEQFFEVPKVLE